MPCLIRPAVLFLALAVSAAPAQTRPGEVSYHGLCDASAAIALGPEHFVGKVATNSCDKWEISATYGVSPWDTLARFAPQSWLELEIGQISHD